MQELQLRLLSDEMLKTCRKLIPVTRKMTEADDSLIIDCFNKYTAAYITADQLLTRTQPSFSLFNYAETNSPKLHS